MIEEAIKANQREYEAALHADDTDTGLLEDESVVEEIERTLKDDDFSDFNEFLENEEARHADLLAFLQSEDAKF